MSSPHKIRVKRVVYERPDINPFAGFGIRELGRLTGWDFSYLSKVRSGKKPISEKKYIELCGIVEKHLMEQPDEDKQLTTPTRE